MPDVGHSGVHYTQITQQVIDKGYYHFTSKTPHLSVNAMLNGNNTRSTVRE
jgi:hypothetical protein